MKCMISEQRLSEVKDSFLTLCRDSGLLTVENAEDYLHHDLLETGIVDSLGVVCLQEQIETHYRVAISQEHLIAELHTLDKLVRYLAANAQVPVPA